MTMTMTDPDHDRPRPSEAGASSMETLESRVMVFLDLDKSEHLESCNQGIADRPKRLAIARELDFPAGVPGRSGHH